MKRQFLGLAAIAIAVSASAFTTANKFSTYFYRYTSSSHAQADIQNISNYVRQDLTCGDGANVCGVYLQTNKPTGQQPVTSEFNAEQSALWSSQQNGSPSDANIDMKE
ncbi:MAG: hypothetical protein ACXVJE_18940 [Mucilaginibacter sp.]